MVSLCTFPHLHIENIWSTGQSKKIHVDFRNPPILRGPSTPYFMSLDDLEVVSGKLGLLNFATFCPEMTQKRFLCCAEFKLTVIQFAKENGNHASEYKFVPPPTEKRIRDWLWEEEALLKTPQQKKAMRGKSAQWSELERELNRWIEEQKAIGIPGSTKMVQHKARIADGQEVTDFKGRHNGCFRFMKLNELSMCPHTRLVQGETVVNHRPEHRQESSQSLS
ncbi:uncharacterized protein LOC141487675 [Macrotis lagotis]|uniref:uncharacterized protein LOC141487675 n=1 Tax=Macrotis lagotis TaxID=92651 RepID=UPI003D68BD41